MTRPLRRLRTCTVAQVTLLATPGGAFAQGGGFAEQDPIAVLLGYLVVFVVAALLYLIPTFVAFSRKHPNRWLIAVINVAFGGTVIGWFGALVWAISAAHLSPTGSNGGESGLNIFANDPVSVRIVPDQQSGPGGSRPATPQDLPVQAAPFTAKPADPNSDTLTKLERLAALRAAGTLSDEEFIAMKAAVLRV